jgi:hypothetical protein
MPPPDELVKVFFRLEQDADGWPPVSSESLWARPAGPNEFVLDNVPWWVRGVACGDRVRAELDLSGALEFREVVESSGRYTIRVIPYGDDPAADQVRRVNDEFATLGAEAESMIDGAAVILALDIPPTAQLAEIKRRLQNGEAAGRWAYEEGCIDDRWSSL